MFLIGEVCGASRKASSNNEPTEVSRCHSSRALKLVVVGEGQNLTTRAKLYLPDERRKAENGRKLPSEE